MEPEVRELLCQRCDREYVVWYVPSYLWNEVVRAHGGDVDGVDHFLCPTCFTVLAQERGVTPTYAWKLSPGDPTPASGG